MIVRFTLDLGCLLGELTTTAMLFVLKSSNVLSSSLEECPHVLFALLELFFVELARSCIILVETSIVL